GHGDAGVIVAAHTGHAVGLRYGCAGQHRGADRRHGDNVTLCKHVSLLCRVSGSTIAPRPPGTDDATLSTHDQFSRTLLAVSVSCFVQAVAAASTAAPRVNQPGSTDGSGMASINMRV